MRVPSLYVGRTLATVAGQQIIPTEDKINLINRLSACGLKSIEATSFVSPKWVPQMGDHQEVIEKIAKFPNVSYPVLVPNLAGLMNVLKNGHATEIAVFGAASDAFSIYVSCVIGCPYEGKIKSSVVARVAEALLDAGCYEVSLGDTIGVGSAGSVSSMLDTVIKSVPPNRLAVHFHDTYGQALANVIVAIEKGIRVADSSVAGLGGCPYAAGATGNLATEDLVYMLNDLGFDTGVDLNKLVDTSTWICAKMGRRNASRVANALNAKRL
ncbi:HMGL-like protein [Ancylostoma ceylanicum]|uniref:hydroxymethylglutaryl-CoA lyase n=1 Tax=Ancylostoma ceylanicum TaxID=53326 RepID=A0A0D6MBM7_9BILA|nr:HMGL-like protein [Ancylostoma ceylanicum]